MTTVAYPPVKECRKFAYSWSSMNMKHFLADGDYTKNRL
jgi:hypothetical protein